VFVYPLTAVRALGLPTFHKVAESHGVNLSRVPARHSEMSQVEFEATWLGQNILRAPMRGATELQRVLGGAQDAAA
jgi:hypothetical protein